MIEWREQKPDISVRPISELGGYLNFLDLAVLLNASRERPVVILRPDCLSAITQHVASSRQELGGLLVGTVYSLVPDASELNPEVILIIKSLPSLQFDSTHVSLTMNAEVWSRAGQVIQEEHLMVVGWYHSHPNLGAFFSGTDRATQRRFFSHSYSVGFVLDPFMGQSRWFLGPLSAEIERAVVCDLLMQK
jgi:proteasome lid subunit RPN8/RPN11